MAQKRNIRIELPELDGNHGKATEYPTGKLRRCILTLETDKAYRGGVDAAARVGWRDSQGFEQYALGIGGGGDFSKTYAVRPGVATQKKIDRLHAEVFTAEMIEQIKAEVRAFYAQQLDRHERDRAIA